jgi:hypothetical protein
LTRRTAIALAVFVFSLTAPLAAVTGPAPADVRASRARLERWRRDPEQLARLRRELADFQKLPAERREQIVRLDRELHDESPATQARLWGALQRYTEWLDRLPEKDRQAVEAAATTAERLAVIKELRDRAWMQARPEARRDEWAKLAGDERSAFVNKLREAERRRRGEWRLAARFWKELEGKQPMPVRPRDFDLRDKDRETSSAVVLIDDYLMAMLGPAEKERLKSAEGRWPDYAVALVEIADSHPFALPGPDGPHRFGELPREVQNRLMPKAAKKMAEALRSAEGQWPGFAKAVVEVNKRKKAGLPLPNELWAYNYRCLLSPMRTFVDETLTPLLTSDEKLRLIHADGQWPKYPQTIQELAVGHGLQPPWQTALPGPRDRWDAYRALRPAQGAGP